MKKIINVIFSVIFSVLIISTIIKFTVGFKQLYYFDIEYLNIPVLSGLSKEDIKKNYDYMIDYLFLDYLIALAIKKDQTVRYAFDKIEPNNPRCDDLLPILGAPYDVNKWLDLKEKTQLFKLTWKADFPKKIGEKYTNYGRLFID